MAISVVILTFNSESYIRKCLESVRWADEIVIVDSFSSDKTIDIAKQYTDKIWQRQWPGFPAQWNFAIDKAGNEWVLILASDEAVTPQLKEEIEDVLTSGNSSNAYFIPRKTYFLKKWIRHCGWYPDYAVRLIRKGFGRFDESRLVHEAVNVEGQPGYLRNQILHYSYSTIQEYIDRMNKYTFLSAQQLFTDKAGIDVKDIKKIAIKKALKKFWNMYIKQGGFKDGSHGFILSFLSSIYQFMTYAKYWEMASKR